MADELGYQHPELRNLAHDLDEKELVEIGKQAVQAYKEDEESRTEWLKHHADWIKLYFQKDKAKNPPWQGASDESIPMLAEACNQFHARAYQAMFPHRKIVQAIPIGKPDSASKARAERVGQHMSWQLLSKDRRYKRDKDRLLLALPLHGSYFTKSYYDPLRKRNVVENVRAVDLVVPYGVGPRDLEDIPRKTQALPITVSKTRVLAKTGYFLSECKPYTRGTGSVVDQTKDRIEGIQQPRLEAIYARVIEQHTLLDLDEDGIDEPYIVTVDLEDESVKRISVRYETDELGNPTADKEPVEYFTHYSFLENPDGFYGLGFGHLIGPLNTAVNKLLRQQIDAGTLANVGNMSGFISKQISAKKGEMNIKLGKFTTTESNVDDLAKGIFQFKFPGPQQSLTEALALILSRSDRLATVTEAITGQTDKVYQPTTVLALIEQSLQVFSSVYERVITAWEDELMKLYRLNGKHLDPAEYFSVMDMSGVLQEAEIARDDYRPDLQIKPIVDPRMTTKQQKMAKAEAEYKILSSSPLVANSPIHLRNATRRFLEAIESDQIDEVLPRVDQMLPPVDDPAKENMGALLPVPMIPPAYPHQDHIAHIKSHTMFLQDPDYGAHISPEGRSAIEAHNRMHIAMMYGQVESGQDGPVAMGADGGNAMVPPGIAPEVQPPAGMDIGALAGGTGEAPGPTGNPGMDSGPIG